MEPLTLVPLLVSIATLILVIAMMCYVYHHREVRKSVQFSKQLRVTEERIENLEARKLMKMARRDQPDNSAAAGGIPGEPDNSRPQWRETKFVAKEMSAPCRRLLMQNENVDDVDRHVAVLGQQEYAACTSTAAECGTTCSAGSLSPLRPGTSAGMLGDRWRRQRQGATVTPLPVSVETAVKDVRRAGKTRVETSPPAEQNAAFTDIDTGIEGVHPLVTGKGGASLTDTHEKWV